MNQRKPKRRTPKPHYQAAAVISLHDQGFEKREIIAKTGAKPYSVDEILEKEYIRRAGFAEGFAAAAAPIDVPAKLKKPNGVPSLEEITGLLGSVKIDVSQQELNLLNKAISSQFSEEEIEFVKGFIRSFKKRYPCGLK